jgi:biotin carboxyl carrier protein
VDLELALRELNARQPDDEARAVLARKETLLLRPLQHLLADPHLLGGFLGRFDGRLWEAEDGGLGFVANPVHFLRALYHYLDLEDAPGKPPSQRIWDHDQEILQTGLDFYERVSQLTGVAGWRELCALLEGARDERIAGADEARWEACRAAHRGFQLGLDLLLLVPRIGVAAGFDGVCVDEELRVSFPERFLDPAAVARCTEALEPPPVAGADEIVSPMGGAFYAREAPHLPPLVDVGDHFETGQPLFVVEVMKMFNKVLAPFSGTVTAKLIEAADGSIVSKGQPIFRIDPDERVERESEETRCARQRETTLSLL